MLVFFVGAHGGRRSLGCQYKMCCVDALRFLVSVVVWRWIGMRSGGMIEIHLELLVIEWHGNKVCREERLVKRMKAYNGQMHITIQP